MKPHFYNYILAHIRPISSCIGGGTGLLLVLHEFSPIFSANIFDIKLLFSVFVAVLAAILLGLFVGLAFLGGFLSNIAGLVNCNVRTCSKGDFVIILIGENRNKVVEIYDIWQERLQVRVNLGEERKEKCQDVFFDYQVLRITGRRRS